jgi:hypothetical protein
MPVRIENTFFTLEEGPFPLSDWQPPSRAAVYGIVMKRANGKNRIIYIGQSGNLSDRGFYRNHHAYPCWLHESGDLSNLYIAYHLMPDSSEEERTEIESDLIEKRDPVCNRPRT